MVRVAVDRCGLAAVEWWHKPQYATRPASSHSDLHHPYLRGAFHLHEHVVCFTLRETRIGEGEKSGTMHRSSPLNVIGAIHHMHLVRTMKF